MNKDRKTSSIPSIPSKRTELGEDPESSHYGPPTIKPSKESRRPKTQNNPSNVKQIPYFDIFYNW